MEPLDKNDKTPLMLAQSHRHGDIVQVLQTEKKRRSSWLPGINEVWGILYGKAGNSKIPLLFFMSSVLLWSYFMYIFRVSIASGKYKLKQVYKSIVFSVCLSHGIFLEDHTTALYTGTA